MPFAPRTHHDWQLRTRTLPLGRRTLIMGVLNVTPDSFSDGGLYYSPQHAPERAVTQALMMLDEGADILDLGGESTRPNATPLTPEEEQARVLPVIESLLQQRPQTILSIDTYHASTARRAIEAGAEIVNDVSGHLWDLTMSATCAELRCGTILMHTRGRPQDWPTLPSLAPDEVLPLIATELKERLAATTSTDIAKEKIVLDPGLGFGKRLDENYPILAHLEDLRELHLPILIGASRKRFLANTLTHTAALATVLQGEPPTMDDRLHATNAANVAGILAGAHILRVHDVRATVEAAAIADRILASGTST
ncbi:MAG: dihydropteroate synthase [Edaphobacter sp.]